MRANGYKSHEQWREKFRKRRSNRFFFIGSKDEKLGNQNCQLLPGKLQVRVLPDLLQTYGQYVKIPVEFSYGQQVINASLQQGRAINYRFVRRDKGWYLHLTTEFPPAPKRTRKALGAIGVDLNKAHLAWAEINRHGNLINYATIATPSQDRSSHQVTATLAEAVNPYAGRLNIDVFQSGLDALRNKVKAWGATSVEKADICLSQGDRAVLSYDNTALDRRFKENICA